MNVMGISGPVWLNSASGISVRLQEQQSERWGGDSSTIDLRIRKDQFSAWFVTWTSRATLTRVNRLARFKPGFTPFICSSANVSSPPRRPRSHDTFTFRPVRRNPISLTLYTDGSTDGNRGRRTRLT